MTTGVTVYAVGVDYARSGSAKTLPRRAVLKAVQGHPEPARSAGAWLPVPSVDGALPV